jgi:hypothetical protein
VRHPLERLLSAWRFLFHSQAWKQMLVNRTDLVALHSRLLSLSWPGFVAEILLGRAGRRGLTPSRLQGCYSETGFHNLAWTVILSVYGADPQLQLMSPFLR